MAADSMDYMRTEDDLRAAFRTAFDHLGPSGVFVTYAEFTPERFAYEGATRTKATTHSRGEVEVTFIEHRFDPDPADAEFEMLFVYVIRRGGDIEVETDRHVHGLFPLATWRRLLEDTGFLVTAIAGTPPDPTPMFASVRP